MTFGVALSPQQGAETQTYRMPPTGSAYPSSSWQRGEYLRSQVSVLLPATLTSGEYRLLLNLVPRAGSEVLAGEPVGLGTLSVEGRVPLLERPEITHRQQVELGAGIVLLGYDLPQTQLPPEGALSLTLYWRAGGPTKVPYKVFTHVLDSDSRVWGQQDSQPQQGQVPTTGWVENEIIVDQYRIPVNEGAPQGLYRIEIGMYDPTNGQRVPVMGPDGRPVPHSRILLDQSVRVYR